MWLLCMVIRGMQRNAARGWRLSRSSSPSSPLRPTGAASEAPGLIQPHNLLFCTILAGLKLYAVHGDQQQGQTRPAQMTKLRIAPWGEATAQTVQATGLIV